MQNLMGNSSEQFMWRSQRDGFAAKPPVVLVFRKSATDGSTTSETVPVLADSVAKPASLVCVILSTCEECFFFKESREKPKCRQLAAT